MSGILQSRIHHLFILLLVVCFICLLGYHFYGEWYYEKNRHNNLNHKLKLRKLPFQQSTRRKKHFWNEAFEERYQRHRKDPTTPLLQVFVVPHSHNDPGWKETFEDYYELKTKYILRNIVKYLQKYPKMTFVWSEVVFLEYWWNNARPSQQKALKKLISEGRLEITAGGWVMPDEACTHIYSLLDQYIEGHEWLKNILGVIPKIGWSIDPFGHGATVPYILDESGFKGTIIQRIHYSWKRWMAEKRVAQFYWVQNWSNKNPLLLVHNLPFDIYSIKCSCGPHPDICMNFDFKYDGIIDFLLTAEEVTEANVLRQSQQLMKEYHRIGSLTTNNVILVPLGDDFRYQHSAEFDSQYQNYTKLFNFINSHREMFNAHVRFGTPSDYFRAVHRKNNIFPTLNGDFFVYSDIFSTGQPAYWSGYFTTRPYFKLLVRQLEHQLRTSEILFTLTYNSMSSNVNSIVYKKFKMSYDKLVSSRRSLGLVQHHDAITGTSTEQVMQDYGTIIIKSFYNCMRLQEFALTIAMIPDITNQTEPVLVSDLELDGYGETVTNQILQIPEFGATKLVLFNSLAEERTEVVVIKINRSNIQVFDSYKNEKVQHQITPVLKMKVEKRNGPHVISDSVFKLYFHAKLPALTAVTYVVSKIDNCGGLSKIICSKCISNDKNIDLRKPPSGDIIIENHYISLLIDRNTGFLTKVKSKSSDTEHKVQIQFGAYGSSPQHSGAYLFKPNPFQPEFRVLERYVKSSEDLNDNIIIFSGPISTEINVIYYPFLIHTIKIYNADNNSLSNVIHMENNIDFEDVPRNRETELFMRIDTDIQNPNTEFYTDQNGFQYQRRIKVDALGIEGNYYPVTTMAWIQDNATRMTYITNHAQGASSFVPGRLEVMLDRRMIYDDERGLGEGIYDNVPIIFQSLLTFENHAGTKPDKYQLPSRTATYLSRSLNYPVHVFYYNTEETTKPYMEFVRHFPEDLFLLTLRTISDPQIPTFPSTSSYMVLQRPGYDCDVGTKINHKPQASFTSKFQFNDILIENISTTSLTGLIKNSDISDMEEIEIDPMELKTIILKFYTK